MDGWTDPSIHSLACLISHTPPPHHLTHTKVFNRLTRLLANEQKLSLSAHALLTVEDPPRMVPYETDPTAPPPRTEEDVLRLIGLPMLPPHLRNA